VDRLVITASSRQQASRYEEELTRRRRRGRLPPPHDARRADWTTSGSARASHPQRAGSPGAKLGARPGLWTANAFLLIHAGATPRCPVPLSGKLFMPAGHQFLRRGQHGAGRDAALSTPWAGRLEAVSSSCPVMSSSPRPRRAALDGPACPASPCRSRSASAPSMASMCWMTRAASTPSCRSRRRRRSRPRWHVARRSGRPGYRLLYLLPPWPSPSPDAPRRYGRRPVRCWTCMTISRTR